MNVVVDRADFGGIKRQIITTGSLPLAAIANNRCRELPGCLLNIENDRLQKQLKAQD